MDGLRLQQLDVQVDYSQLGIIIYTNSTAITQHLTGYSLKVLPHTQISLSYVSMSMHHKVCRKKIILGNRSAICSLPM